MKSWLKSKKLWAGLAVVLLVAVMAVSITRKLNGPAYGSVGQAPSSAESVGRAKAPAPRTYSGQYFSFTIPNIFKVVPAPNNAGELEVVNLFSTNHTSKAVAIRVVRESINNDPGVNYRRQHPAIYKEQSSSADAAFSKKQPDGSEYTAYLTHNGLVVSVSISSPFQADLSSDYQAIAASWQWK